MQKSFPQRAIIFLERGTFAPFLLAIQSALYIYLINSTEVFFSDSIRAILGSFLLGGLVLVLAYFLVRGWQKASLIASLFVLLFFVFGDLSDWIIDTWEVSLLQADLFVLMAVTVYMILWIWFVQKRLKNINIASVNLFFNLLGFLFIIYCGVLVRTSELGNYLLVQQDSLTPVVDAGLNSARPDIYYIILDGYARKDVLQALYDFNDTDFLEALKTRGFYVAEESSSNYVQTMLSLSSSLNMDYLQSLKARGINLENRQDLTRLLENSKVRAVLAQNGYQLISFRNSSHIAIRSAEIYYDNTRMGPISPVNAFESNVINRTLVRVLIHVPAINKMLFEIPYDTHRGQILDTFEKLQQIPTLEGDNFVVAHIIAPHPPFVFDENGYAVLHNEPFTLSDGNNYIKDHSCESFIIGYCKQVTYMNKLVLETIDEILAASEPTPIIIIQSDHGPGSQFNFDSLEKTLPAERFSILNAYYFPDQDYSALYPSISPVNSFRVLLNQFFGENYVLIPDYQYYSTWSLPYNFVEVTDLSLPLSDQH